MAEMKKFYAEFVTHDLIADTSTWAASEILQGDIVQLAGILNTHMEEFQLQKLEVTPVIPELSDTARVVLKGMLNGRRTVLRGSGATIAEACANALTPGIVLPADETPPSGYKDLDAETPA